MLLATLASVKEEASFSWSLKTLARALPSGVISEAMLLAGIGFLVPGKKICATELKSPFSIAVLGTVWRDGLAFWRSRFHSCPQKKNSLSFLIGPPIV